ncbi:hypothetical protein L284_22485 [Novosphingobium lindaniclasticum LE124]|uniref:Uncharacterized protein n=1 Tax=Novosphingobium lindaniclasticum LE124 TaxID=1096930 RepID=T0IDC9_9SPHN|nr:hypothetical protein L284_22485 [Novosphingobium lindaniclasticum LE124]
MVSDGGAEQIVGAEPRSGIVGGPAVRLHAQLAGPSFYHNLAGGQPRDHLSTRGLIQTGRVEPLGAEAQRLCI